MTKEIIPEVLRKFSRTGILTLAVLLASAVLVIELTGVARAQEEVLGDKSGEDLPLFKPRPDGEAVPGQIIVKFKEDAGPAVQADVRRSEGLEKVRDLDLIDAEVDKVRGQSVEQAIRDLERRSDVEYAEPDYVVYPTGYADEPRFRDLWGLHNSGQVIEGSTGTSNVDVNGLEASKVTQGNPNLVVAVIDDGVDFSHPDLAGRQWRNPGESGSGKETNGIDDDGNGKVDDANGWDVCHQDKTVHDPGDDSHGTHVAGTIAASVNGQGVVGVAPNVKIMALKFLSATGTGTGCNSTSGAIQAIQYAKSKGAKISNNSWGGGGYSQALKDAIDASGSLFIAAAGNGGADSVGDNNDTSPMYPASYNSANILSVAAVNNKGSLGGFSNYGATTVDISAPGVSVLSAVPANPGSPAAVLSSVGTSGRAVTAGFGAEEIGGPDKRASFMTKAFQAVGRGSQQVVLVDDDRSHAYYTDVGPTVAAAIQSATGSAPQTIQVGDGDGPSLSQLSGKTVVWATGEAFYSGFDADFNFIPNLSPADQATLTNFLSGGGKLVITGRDVLYDIESSAFVTTTLDLAVDPDTYTQRFTGASGTAFAGESYTFDSPFADEFGGISHDGVAPVSSTAKTQGGYNSTPATWESWPGTSMATPHVTGVAALAASVNSGLLSKPVDLKKLIMNTGKPLPATAGKTVTGDMADAKAAVVAATPDNKAPGGTVKINGGAAYTKSPSVKLSLLATDPAPGSGVASMRFMNDGGSWSGWMSYATTKSWILKKTNGTRTVYVQYKDKAGNVSTSALDRIVLDMTKPTVSGMSPRPASVTRDTTPTIKATVRDNLTNLAKGNIRLYVAGKAIPASKFSYSRATDQLVYNSPRLSKGKKTVRIVARDAAGNAGVRSWYFTIR
jgi:subtilisin family serine protease